MSIIVFVGPTLPRDAAEAELSASYRPPAALGDVVRAALEGPSMIGLIDGYFEHSPAVWHKEILFAMARGIHVLGAASMGALRAVELAPFGMEGVGHVFEQFEAQVLDGDDEVAVAHGAADSGYRCISEALVNIRATLRAAQAAGIVSHETEVRLVELAKATYYPERTYPGLLSCGAAEGLSGAELAALRDFLARGAVNQKRRDAVDLLRTMRARADAEGGLAPKRVTWHFEHTNAWEHLLQSLGVDAPAGGRLA